MQFSLVPYVLAITVILAGINIFLIRKLKRSSVFHQFLMYFNLYLVFHILYVIVFEELFIESRWFDQYGPFSLIYGPFLYFAAISMAEQRLKKKIVFLHLFPPLLFSLGFFYLVLFNQPENLTLIYNKAINFYTVFSYSIYILLTIRQSIYPVEKYPRARKLLLLGAIILLIFVTLIEFSIIISHQYWLSDHVAVNLLRALVFSALMVCATFIFRYLMADVFYKLFLYEVSASTSLARINTEVVHKGFTKYEKSLLTDKQLDEYEDMLEKSMLLHKTYLDVELSHQKLAHLLRIPGHHLTQVLSLRLKQSFYEYVNNYRIQHACTLLKQEQQINLEELAAISGFNSKVSFNRNFKNRMGCTPSSYREKAGR